MPDDGTLSDALNAKDTTNADTAAATEAALTDGETVRFNARVPEPLRDAFSDLCQRKGRSASSVVREWMLDAVKNGEI